MLLEGFHPAREGRNLHVQYYFKVDWDDLKMYTAYYKVTTAKKNPQKKQKTALYWRSQQMRFKNYIFYKYGKNEPS